MTYILGARCKDGVVLVGDTKITIDEGANYAYGEKLFKPFLSVVMGASGISGLYKSFQDRMISAVVELEKQKIKMTPENIRITAENVIRGMHNVYGEDRHIIINNLNVLMALRINASAELINFSGIGFPEPVNEIKAIGHGEPYGALFLKKLWHKGMTMEQTAKLGVFIIKLIQDTNIDNSVGYDTEFLPQVYYLPDISFPTDFNPNKFSSQEELQKSVDDIFNKKPIQQLSKDNVNQFINEISSKISDFEMLFKSGQFKI